MEVPRNKLNLKDDPAVLSPPILTKPLYACAKTVKVTGYVPGATLDLEIDGAMVITAFGGGSPAPSGAMIRPPSPLVEGQQVRARQNHLTATSNWTDAVTVTDHTVDYPAGLPRPELFGDYSEWKCGVRTGVKNLLPGCDVQILTSIEVSDPVAGSVVGSVSGANNPQGVDVSPAYIVPADENESQVVRARAELCNDKSPLSYGHIVESYTSTLPTPEFGPIFSGATQVVLDNVLAGARATISRNDVLVGTFPCSGGKSMFDIHPPFHLGEVFKARQELCPEVGHSPAGTATVQPCSALPAAQVGPVQAGDTQIVLTEFVPGSEIKVFVNNTKTGDGSGPTVELTAPIPYGASIDVWQILGTCSGSTVQQVKATCVNPPVSGDPTALDLFPTGGYDYGIDRIAIDGFSYDVFGSIVYPADNDSLHSAPFNKRLAALGRVPVVVIVARSYSAKEPGTRYLDYLSYPLTQMGFIVLSPNVDATDKPDDVSGGAQNLVRRAKLAIASIAFLQKLDASDPIFKGKIDFGRVGLVGHGRDGDCVLAMAERMNLEGVTIRAVLSVAPTNSGANSGKPHGYAFMTMLPAADGVAFDNDGAQYYDQATPDPFKVQLYIDHANHNYFIEDLLHDDTNGALPVMSRAEHRRILSAYGCAFFRYALRGDATFGYLDRTLLPEHVQNQNIHMSYEVAGARTVDNYEKHPITIDNEGQATARLNGLTAKDFPFAQVSGAFNASFFGNTTGIVCSPKDNTSSFREPLKKPADLTKAEVRVRAAEVYREPIILPDPAGFRVGVEDIKGTIAWVDVNSVGGLPRPFGRRAFDFAQGRSDKTKTMLSTFRFPGSCFGAAAQSLMLNEIQAIHLGLNQPDGRSIAFDDLEIVES